MEKDKLTIVKWVVNQNDEGSVARVMDLLHEIDYDLKSQRQVIGQRSNGKIITKSKFIDCIRVAEHNTSEGDFIAFDELEKESENW